MKDLYFVISETQTGFGRLLRRFGKLQYNHAAISLDAELHELYAFARPEQYGYFVAHLVRETTDRYLVNALGGIRVCIFRVPVSDDDYAMVRDEIYRVLSDKAYKYNLFSVLTYPMFKGFSTYKAFSCIEFVMHLLSKLPVCELDRPLPRYQPDDLKELLGDYIYYEGNLLDYIPDRTESEDYFNRFSRRLMVSSTVALSIICYRTGKAAWAAVLRRLLLPFFFL